MIKFTSPVDVLMGRVPMADLWRFNKVSEVTDDILTVSGYKGRCHGNFSHGGVVASVFSVDRDAVKISTNKKVLAEHDIMMEPVSSMLGTKEKKSMLGTYRFAGHQVTCNLGVPHESNAFFNSIAILSGRKQYATASAPMTAADVFSWVAGVFGLTKADLKTINTSSLIIRIIPDLDGFVGLFTRRVDGSSHELSRVNFVQNAMTQFDIRRLLKQISNNHLDLPAIYGDLVDSFIDKRFWLTGRGSKSDSNNYDAISLSVNEGFLQIGIHDNRTSASIGGLLINTNIPTGEWMDKLRGNSGRH